MATSFALRVDPDDVQHLFDANNSSEPKAVLTQVIVMTALSILSILVFTMLRPTYKIVYEPKMTYHAPNKRPPPISSSFFGWISPLLRHHEEELFHIIGLDAITFLRFLHLMRWLFTITALLSCGILIPLDFLYTSSTNPPNHDLLSSMTIRDVQGVRLYAHIGVTYFVTILLMVLVYHHWKAMYRLRNQWFRSPEYQHAFYARALLITNIPPRYRSNEGLWKIFDGMKLPYQVTSVHIGKDVGMLPDLVKQHNKRVEELEKVLVKHSRKTSYDDEERPTIRVGGFLWCGGTHEDAIKLYTSQLKQSEAAAEQCRAQLATHQPEHYGFATFASIPIAHRAAYDLRGEHPKGLSFRLAPNPRDIFWKNIGLNKPRRRLRKVTGFIAMIFFCALSLVPLFPIASLANLDVLAQSGAIPFLKTWISVSPTTYTLVYGIVPPAVAAVFGFFLPRLMRWLSKHMGANSLTRLDHDVVARYFMFMVVSQLIIFTIIGVLFNAVLEIIDAAQLQKVSLKIILDNLSKLPARITRTYVDQSTFWLTWFPLRGFLAIFDLAQIANLILVSLRTRFVGRSPREIRDWSKPKDFDYAIEYSNLLFMGTVGLLFAPLAPLVALAAAVVFWTCSWVYKYQLMYVFVTSVESGGRAWNVIVNRLLFSAVFMQVIMIFTVGLQIEFKSLQFLATIPPFVLTLFFKHYLNKRFANDFQYFLPRHEELTRAIVHTEQSDVGGQKLEARYGHPAWHLELFSPMVHKDVMPLLRRNYKGGHRPRDLSRGFGEKSIREKGGSTTVDVDEVFGGVEFVPVKKRELACDPAQYSLEREAADCDFDAADGASFIASSSEDSAPWRRGLAFPQPAVQGHSHNPHTSGIPQARPIQGSAHEAQYDASFLISGGNGQAKRPRLPSSTSTTPTYHTGDETILSGRTLRPPETYPVHPTPSETRRISGPSTRRHHTRFAEIDGIEEDSRHSRMTGPSRRSSDRRNHDRADPSRTRLARATSVQEQQQAPVYPP